MNSKEQKTENLILYAQLTGLFLVLISLFLGSFYAFDGSLFIAIPISLVLVAAMYYIIWHMVSAKMDKKRTGYSFGKKALWMLYILIALPVSFFVAHAFNVEFQESENIKRIGIEKTSSLNSLKSQYVNAYGAYLNTKRGQMVSNIQSYFNGDISSSNELQTKLNIKNGFNVFLSGVNENNIESAVDSYLSIEKMKFQRADTSLFGMTEPYIEMQESIILNWSRLSLNFVLSDLDDKIKMTYDKLGKFLEENAEGRKLNFDEKKYTEPTLIAQPVKLFMKSFNIYLILLLIILQVLMLLPYFLAPARVYKKIRKEGSTGGVTIR